MYILKVLNLRSKTTVRSRKIAHLIESSESRPQPRYSLFRGPYNGRREFVTGWALF